MNAADKYKQHRDESRLNRPTRTKSSYLNSLFINIAARPSILLLILFIMIVASGAVEIIDFAFRSHQK